MKRYNPKAIETKWQNKWQSSNLYKAEDFDPNRAKFVMLTEFPYPSGTGMHIGHMREYTLGDIIARFKRMQGYNVLFPMGYDAFGLPTENFAIKNKITPQKATLDNVANFNAQLKAMGFSFDWQRSFNTSDPSYYKWTQWLFLQFFKAGLAYQEEIAVNWCPFCRTGLANEEVINGRHERCDTPVEKKLLKQWMLRITDYADRLIEGLGSVDYPDSIAEQQINWVGRSKGAEINFKLVESDTGVAVFTTRPDTIYGATFLVLAPEHPLVAQITTKEQKSAVRTLVKSAAAKTELERQSGERDKTGVFSGAYAVNPASGEQIPIWIADYVLMGYGTGAIMAVPGHDERDFSFALKYQLPIRYVIEPVFGAPSGDDIEKEAIVAVVRNPASDEVLMLDWGPRQARHGGRLFIGGGVESGEDPLICAKREIEEETGYSELKLVAELPYLVHSYYYSNVKEANYHAKVHGFLFDVTSKEAKPTKLDSGEKGKFKPVWRSVSKVVADDPAHAHIFAALFRPEAVKNEGIMANSDSYDGSESYVTRDKVVIDLSRAGTAKEKINYRLRDWIFSRQRYWGEPIPLIHCPKHGVVAVPEKDLPVVLPPVEDYEPTENGASPLAGANDWVNTVCPLCGVPALRETDTMPNWAGSSWYYLRYYDPKNDKVFAEPKKLAYWGGVDLYLGGTEHITLHLLYSRFWHQFLYDKGLVPTPEPYLARRSQGIILAADGTKMSKSKGNIADPTEIIDSGYGADALRLAVTFLAPYPQTTPWSPESLGGTFRFLQRLWTLTQEYLRSPKTTAIQHSGALKQIVNQAVKRVDTDLINMNFNTAIASLMECLNGLYKVKAEDNFSSTEWPWALETILKLLAPFAPHISEELWQQLGGEGSIHVSSWPAYDEKLTLKDNVTIAVQINGKVRGEVSLARESTEVDVKAAAIAEKKLATYLEGKEILRVIYVKDKLLSLVVR